MSIDLSPENERFIRQLVNDGAYPNESEAVDDAIGLLKLRKDLLSRIAVATGQLESGQYTEFDDDSLREYFDGLQTRGRERYEARVSDN